MLTKSESNWSQLTCQSRNIQSDFFGIVPTALPRSIQSCNREVLSVRSCPSPKFKKGRFWSKVTAGNFKFRSFSGTISPMKSGDLECGVGDCVTS